MNLASRSMLLILNSSGRPVYEIIGIADIRSTSQGLTRRMSGNLRWCESSFMAHSKSHNATTTSGRLGTQSLVAHTRPMCNADF